jgi:5-formyltetrahydrofolate cyclo-ligase
VSDAVDAQKRAVRQRLLAARGSVGNRDQSAAAVCQRLTTLPELITGHVVLGYAAHGSELSIDAALRRLLDAGVTVCLPWVEGVMLGLGVITDLEADLTPGWRGVREPRVPRRPLRPQAVDAVLVPGVGFDPLGNRLGYGGGHFDRLLGRLRRGVPLIGVAYDEQVVTQLPVAPHDRPVDVVITPSRTLRTSRL